MIKIKCPVCGGASYYRSTSIDMMKLAEGGIVALQCGHEVRGTGTTVQQDADAPYVEVEVFRVRSEEE